MPKKAEDSVAQQAFEEDVWQLESALVRDPQDAALHAELGQLYEAHGFQAEACKHLEAARAFAPDHEAYTFLLIDHYLQGGEADQALLYLQDFLNHPPESPEKGIAILSRLGHAFFILGKWQDAWRAFLEVLAQPIRNDSSYNALLYALKIALDQGTYAQADLILQHVAPEALPLPIQGMWLFLKGQVSYWRGEFSLARQDWEAALAHQFNEAAFGALHLVPPAVMQSQSEKTRWDEHLKETVQLFLQRPRLPSDHMGAFFNPFDFSLSHDAEEVQRLKTLGQWYTQHFELPQAIATPTSQQESLQIGVIVDVLDAVFCAFVLPWLQDYFLTSPDYVLTVFYRQGEGLPECLMPYQDVFYQLPSHTASALKILSAVGLKHLFFSTLRGDLYRMAMTPVPGANYHLLPLFQYESGLSTVSQKVVQKLTEAGLFLSGDCLVPQDTLPTRRDLQLPSLGHLYLFAMPVTAWLPALDELIDAILQADCKAFILGLKAKDSTWHVRVQQRHETTLSRPHRVRWLDDALDPLALLPLMNAVVGVRHPHSDFILWQALRQGINVGYFDVHPESSPLRAFLAQHAFDCLSENAFSLAKVLTERVGHVRLENTSFPALSADRLKVWESILLSLEETS